MEQTLRRALEVHVIAGSFEPPWLRLESLETATELSSDTDHQSQNWNVRAKLKAQQPFASSGRTLTTPRRQMTAGAIRC